jgi:predicted XRE-type DNA-binding protein
LRSEALSNWSGAMLGIKFGKAREAERERKDREAETEKKAEFIRLLKSSESKRTIIKLAPDILEGSELTPILHDVREKLHALSVAEIARFTAYTDETLDAAKGQISHFQAQLQVLSAAELRAAKGQFNNFLRSEEGERVMLHLLKEALVRGELAPFLGAAQTRLKDLAADEFATFMAQAEISLKASADAHAVAVEQEKANFDTHANKITRDIATFMAQAEISLKASAEGHAVEVAGFVWTGFRA